MATKKTTPKKTTAKKVITKKSVAPRAVAKRVTPKKVIIKPSWSVKPIVPTAPKPVENTDGIFHVFMSYNDKIFEGNTDTLAAFVQAYKPDRLNTKTIMRFSLNTSTSGKIVERVLNIPMARRYFNNPMAAQLLEKGIKMGLGYNGEI